MAQCRAPNPNASSLSDSGLAGLIVLVVPGTATEYGGALTGAVIWRKAADLVWGSFFDPIRYRRADQLIGAALLA